MKKVKSSKGELVDFDLIKIKQQMTTAPLPLDVKQRQDFIENRLRRRVRKVPPPAPKVEAIEVEPEMPSVEEAAGLIEDKVVEEKPEATETKTKKTKQRARPKSDK